MAKRIVPLLALIGASLLGGCYVAPYGYGGYGYGYAPPAYGYAPGYYHRGYYR